jgi:hypothetical protein
VRFAVRFFAGEAVSKLNTQHEQLIDVGSRSAAGSCRQPSEFSEDFGASSDAEANH